MNDTIPPLARKLVDFLRCADNRFADEDYLLEETARMIDEHVPLKQFESDFRRIDTLEEMLRQCPGMVIAYGDDPDEECDDTPDGMVPVGFRITTQGCNGTRCDVANDLRTLIDKAAVPTPDA